MIISIIKIRMMNKKQYLQNKEVIPPDLGIIYVIKSTRFGINMIELPIWGIENCQKTVFYSDGPRKINYNKYILKESPFKAIIEDGKEYGKDHGYASGIGDLWEWSYFFTLKKEVAEDILHSEKVRIIEKYHLIF